MSVKWRLSATAMQNSRTLETCSVVRFHNAMDGNIMFLPRLPQHVLGLQRSVFRTTFGSGVPIGRRRGRPVARQRVVHSMEWILRFIVGAFVVSFFAVLGDILKAEDLCRTLWRRALRCAGDRWPDDHERRAIVSCY